MSSNNLEPIPSNENQRADLELPSGVQSGGSLPASSASEKKSRSGKKTTCIPQFSVDFEVVALDRVAFKASVNLDKGPLEFFSRFLDTSTLEVDLAKKIIYFPFCLYDQVLSELKKLVAGVPNQPPPGVLKALKKAVSKPYDEAVEALVKEAVERVPRDLWNILARFQQEAVEFGIWRKGRVFFADEMGLGKTLQALALACVYREEWPLLIICPASMRLSWASQVEKWVSGLEASEIVVLGKSKDPVRGKVVIVSYDLAKNMAEELDAYDFQVVIADESHSMRAYKTKRAQMLLPLIANAPRRMLLSGTPALNKPSELLGQITLLAPKLFDTNKEYLNRYCDPQSGPYVYGRYGGYTSTLYLGATHSEELYLVLRSTIMIRRLKQDVLDLPTLQREMVLVSLAPAQEKMMQKLIQEKFMSRFSNFSRHRYGGGSPEMLSILSDMSAATGTFKLKAVGAYLNDLLDSGIKIVVFAHHQSVMNGLANLLAKRNVDYIRIDGTTPINSRHSLCERFQNEAQCQVALLSITAAGVGLTLTAASTVVFTELYWIPGILRQAEDRCHRIGQTNPVRVIYLIARNTIDTTIWAKIEKKLGLVTKVLDGKDTTMEVALTQQTEIEPLDTANDELIFAVMDVIKSRFEYRCEAKSRGRSKGKYPSDDDGGGEGYTNDDYDDDDDGSHIRSSIRSATLADRKNETLDTKNITQNQDSNSLNTVGVNANGSETNVGGTMEETGSLKREREESPMQSSSGFDRLQSFKRVATNGTSPLDIGSSVDANQGVASTSSTNSVE